MGSKQNRFSSQEQSCSLCPTMRFYNSTAQTKNASHRPYPVVDALNIKFHFQQNSLFTFRLACSHISQQDAKTAHLPPAASVPFRSQGRPWSSFRLAGLRLFLRLELGHVQLFVNYFWNGFDLRCKLLLNLVKRKPTSVKQIQLAIM